MPEDRKYLWVIHAQSSYEPSRISYNPSQTLEQFKNEARKVFPKLSNTPNNKICFLEGAKVLRASDRCEKFRVGNSTTFPLVLTNNVDDSYSPFNWVINMLPPTAKSKSGSSTDCCCCDIFESDSDKYYETKETVNNSLRKKEMQPMKVVINGDVSEKDIL